MKTNPVAFQRFAFETDIIFKLKAISKQFASEDHWGPTAVANFEEAEGAEREMLQRDAHERVKYLLSRLGLWNRS